MKPLKSIAHVGHNKSPDDTCRIFEVIEWLNTEGFVITGKGDFINLNNGRDFLAEKNEYEVVVLHFLFRGGFQIPNQNKGQLAVSPLTSWAGWRRRLVQSGAKFIFAYGGGCEVGGTFLVNLDGYKVHKVRTDDMDKTMSGDPADHKGLWVFEKEE